MPVSSHLSCVWLMVMHVDYFGESVTPGGIVLLLLLLLLSLLLFHSFGHL